MVNIIGAEGFQGHVVYEGLDEVLQIENAFVHIYGKMETKPGRKMGHVTIISAEKQELIHQSNKVKRLLKVRLIPLSNTAAIHNLQPFRCKFLFLFSSYFHLFYLQFFCFLIQNLINEKIFLYIFIIAPLVIAACGGKDKKGKGANANNGTPQKQPPLSVDAMIVASSTLNAQIEIPGTILANESTEIHPESSGRLVLLNVKEGALVGKGTLLAKLYDGDMLAQLNSLNVQIKKQKCS
jgi:hypothetical protein